MTHSATPDSTGLPPTLADEAPSAVRPAAPEGAGAPDAPDDEAFLSVRDLKVSFHTEDGVVQAVDGLSFGVRRGQTLGIVGESGSGKSVASLAVMGLHGSPSAEITGKIELDGQELIGAGGRTLERLRGNRMAMIFQDPLTALSPYYTIGHQIAEPYRKHLGGTKRQARERAVEMLDRVGIPHPKLRVDDYPHQFSGGMRQRAMIAMSLVCNPDLLIADEPTTALDVTVQAQILDLLNDLQEEFGSAIIMITHDLGVVSKVADDVLVMYAGRAAERGSVGEVLRDPRHPYTWGLLTSMPSLHGDVEEELSPIPGTPPSLLNPPSGCAFHPRCSHREAVGGSRCVDERPPLAHGRGVACHLGAEQGRRIFTEQISPRLGREGSGS